MGYDDFECFACYCRYGCNNLIEIDIRHRVCLSCIDTMTRNGHITASLIDVLKESRWLGNTTCELCDEKCIMSIEISLCNYHLASELSDREEEEEEREGDSEELIFQLG